MLPSLYVSLVSYLPKYPVPPASCISPVRAAANRVASSAGMVKVKTRWLWRVYSIHMLPSLYVSLVSYLPKYPVEFEPVVGI